MNIVDRLADAPEEVRPTSGVELTPRDSARVLDGFRSAITRLFGGEAAEHYAAPPVIARRTAERAGYPTAFPQLLGTVHAAPLGGEPAATDLVLTPAACHHLYPLIADRDLPSTVSFSVEATCFRAEATAEPGRLRSFRMYEVVYVGAEAEVMVWRDAMLKAADAWLRELGLSTDVVAANDPFFGRPGKLMASAQRSQQLKWEITADVAEGLTQAVASANCHREHFGEAFAVTTPEGRFAHSACLAFGLDRLALALRHLHGPATDQWPARVREQLSL